MGRPRKHPRRYYRAKESFFFADPETGLQHSFHKGELLPDGPLLRKCLQFFDPLDEDYPVDAVLGEKRQR